MNRQYVTEDKCTICQHPDRAEIEAAILNMTVSTPPSNIDNIAEAFNVDPLELRQHALFHVPLTDESDLEAVASYQSALDGVSFDELPQLTPEPRQSLTRKMKLREADMLMAVANEYLVTLKTIGRRINKLASISSIDVEDEEKQLKLARLLTKPIVDLYVGIGSEIRQTVRATAELDRLLNGPEENQNSGLQALAAAIAMSGNHQSFAEQDFPMPEAD